MVLKQGYFKFRQECNEIFQKTLLAFRVAGLNYLYYYCSALYIPSPEPDPIPDSSSIYSSPPEPTFPDPLSPEDPCNIQNRDVKTSMSTCQETAQKSFSK